MATLMMHRDVLTDFGRLPAKVQKKVSELIRKFQEDSTQASINLEKVEQAVDDKVRSARVGDDWRAIVIAPKQGSTFLLMHVDHHDEAYRWCQNKRFEAHGALGVLQIFDIDMAQEAAERSRPTDNKFADETAYPLDRLSDHELFQAGVPYALIPAVRAIRSDAAFEEVVEYLPPEAGQVLFWVVAGRSLTRHSKKRSGRMMLDRPSRRDRATSPSSAKSSALTWCWWRVKSISAASSQRTSRRGGSFSTRISASSRSGTSRVR